MEVGVVILNAGRNTMKPQDGAEHKVKKVVVNQRKTTFSKSRGLSLNWEVSGAGSWVFSSSSLESSRKGSMNFDKNFVHPQSG